MSPLKGFVVFHRHFLGAERETSLYFSVYLSTSKHYCCAMSRSGDRRKLGIIPLPSHYFSLLPTSVYSPSGEATASSQQQDTQNQSLFQRSCTSALHLSVVCTWRYSRKSASGSPAPSLLRTTLRGESASG